MPISTSEVEEITCQILGLKPDTASTQVISRDMHAEFMMTLAGVGASIERFAVEIRNLQRTDVLEVEEFFAKGSKGVFGECPISAIRLSRSA